MESLRAAAGFLSRAWRRPWFVAILAATLSAGIAVMAVADPSSWVSSAVALGTVFYLPLIQGPLYALALGDAPGSPSLKEGAGRYLRLVAVGLLTDVFLGIPGLLIFVVGLGAAYGMAYSHPGFDRMDVSTWTASGPVLAGGLVVLAVGGLAMLWLSARVALGAAATVVEGRILMISTWPLTQGKGWRLAGARLIVSLVVLAVVVAVSVAARAVAPTWAARAIPLTSGALFLGFRLPLKVGVMSYFYRHRTPLPTP